MRSSNPKIFIVDDDPLLSTMLKDYLTNRNEFLSIQSFSTGEACLAALDQQPDLIILDYYLNSRSESAANGIHILKAIKKRFRALPVVMLSGQESYGTAAKTIQHGAIHYVIKGQDAFAEINQLINANV